MKNILLILLVCYCTISCSKDDGPPPLNVEFGDLVGRWHFKEVVKSDGQVVQYQHRCTTQRDYIEFFAPFTYRKGIYLTNCSLEANQCTGTFVVDNVVDSCDPDMFNGEITVLNNTTLRIDYYEAATLLDV